MFDLINYLATVDIALLERILANYSEKYPTTPEVLKLYPSSFRVTEGVHVQYAIYVLRFIFQKWLKTHGFITPAVQQRIFSKDSKFVALIIWSIDRRHSRWLTSSPRETCLH